MYATALREAIDECDSRAGDSEKCVLEAKSNGTLIVEKMWDRTILGENCKTEIWNVGWNLDRNYIITQ